MGTLACWQCFRRPCFRERITTSLWRGQRLIGYLVCPWFVVDVGVGVFFSKAFLRRDFSRRRAANFRQARRFFAAADPNELARQWVKEAQNAHAARMARRGLGRQPGGGGGGNPLSSREFEAQPSLKVGFGLEGSGSLALDENAEEEPAAAAASDAFLEPPSVATVLRCLQGVPVEARYKGRAQWFGAVVESARADGSLNLSFDDGDHAVGTPRFRVRLPGQVAMRLFCSPFPSRLCVRSRAFLLLPF